ncbi:MAG TPA: ABC transporter ATP-binding protein [Spirochaetales bacterium]|nr:ABC transporter ATP-binding protein [Spirochaetales bacterium]HRZ64997.1 ABC transporter ATP-binding protein [Spirochaetia bacterium]
MGEYAIEMAGITKVFPGVVANDGVDLRVRDGEIHALLGENGAGKSTLMSILFGLYEADSGSIRIRGADVRIHDPNEANALGIGMVHQHFKLVHNYTVAENIVLGLEPRTRTGGVDLGLAERRVAELSRQYGLSVDPRARVESITVGMQQRVEILKILYRNADILIFDEPTAVLTPQEVDELMAILERLRSEGKTIVLITHKLREIKQAAERCTVLRRGKVVGTVEVAATSEEAMAEMMVGREVKFRVDKAAARPGELVLKIEGLTVKNAKGFDAVRGLDLEVRSGEIVGLAGVDGNGQAELIEAITGLASPEAGRILLKGRDIAALGIRERIRLGVGHVPEDRHKHGLVLKFRLDENLALKSFDRPPFSGFAGILRPKAMAAHASEMIGQFDIRAAEGPATTASSMSGGNQQKAIIAREIDLSPELLVVAQPTRGLDVGAIEYIHRRIVAERDKGRAVLLVSYELDEILDLCDRIAAISKGEIVGVVDAAGADERAIGAMMAGLRAPGGAQGAGAGA